jgi:hypothetical protein
VGKRDLASAVREAKDKPHMDKYEETVSYCNYDTPLPILGFMYVLLRIQESFAFTTANALFLRFSTTEVC